MFTRMEQIKIGKLFEDDVTTINQVAEALHSVGIEMMQDADTFRPMGDVLDELGKKWDTLTQKQQSAIAGTISGVRQAPQFLVLMQNYNEVLRAQGIELDSTGLAAQRYAIYQDNVQAAMNRSTAAWQGFWQATTQSDQIKWFYDASAAIGNFLTQLGGLPPILVMVIGLLIALKGEAIKTGIAVNIATGGIPLIIGAIVTGIGFGWAAINGFSKSTGEALDEINTKINEYKTNLEGLKSGAERLADIGNEYEILRKKSNLTNDEQKRFIELQNIIHGILPEVSGDYDELGNYTLDAGTALSTLIDLQKEEIRVMREKLQLETLTGAEVRIKNLKDLQAEQDKLNAKVDKYRPMVGIPVRGTGEILVTAEKFADITAEATEKSYELQNAISEERIKYLSLSVELRTLQLLKYKELNLTEDVIRAITGETKGREKVIEVLDEESRHLQEVIIDIEKLAQIEKEYASVIGSLGDNIRELNTIERKQKEGTLTLDEIMQLISAHSEYIKYIQIEGGVITLNTAAMKAYTLAQVQVAIGAAMVANATAKEIAMLVALKNEIFEWASTLGEAVVGGVGGAVETAEDKIRDLRDMVVSMIRQQKEAEKETLRDQLENYTKIINAQKEKLRLIKDELDYRDELAEKEKDVSNIQMQLDALALDNSEEAKARRLQLEEDLGDETTDLARFQRDKQYEDAQDALDKELDTYREKIEAQIDLIDEYLSRPGQILRDVMEMIAEKSDNLYQSLIAWNKEYGTGINEDVTGAWDRATVAVQKYQETVNQTTFPPTSFNIPYKRGINIPARMEQEGGWIPTGMGEPGQDSIHTLLTPGEYVLRKNVVDALGVPLLDKINSGIYNGIPSTNTLANSQTSIGNLLNIVVEGNLDKATLPDLQTLAKQIMGELNKNFISKGYLRATNQYVI